MAYFNNPQLRTNIIQIIVHQPFYEYNNKYPENYIKKPEKEISISNFIRKNRKSIQYSKENKERKFDKLKKRKKAHKA